MENANKDIFIYLFNQWGGVTASLLYSIVPGYRNDTVVAPLVEIYKLEPQPRFATDKTFEWKRKHVSESEEEQFAVIV